MKKLVMACGIAALAIATVSCTQSSSKSNDSFADSIAEYMGTVQGSDIASSYANLDSAQRATMSKDAILAGIKTVLMADTADKGYLAGLNIGIGLMQQASYPDQAGVKIDRQLLFEKFAAAFKADSVADMTQNRQTLQGLMMQLQRKAMEAQQAAEKARREEAANSPEAKANEKAGSEYTAKLKAEDKAYQTTESGLVYKVDKAGSGASPKDTDVVKVKYTGRHIDGTTFDTSGDRAVDFPVNGVVPGFSEALKMIKKGAKYTVIIPGNLAYGPEGTPDGNIKANETLVFDIELVDINAKK